MNELKKNLINLLAPLIASISVFIFYAHTLSYSWKFFDEDIIYNETILPIPKDFSNYIEIIRNFGLISHFEASNTFYSDIANIRGTPLDTIFLLTLFLLFKKSSFYYHLFSLLLHTANTFILSLSINKIIYIGNNSNTFKDVTLTVILSLIWALHPTNVESVLFATNVGALITYFFCSLYLLLFVSLLDVKNNKINEFTRSQQFTLFLFYLFPLFLNEYSVTLPIMIFSLLFLYSRAHLNLPIMDSIKLSLSKILPLLLSLTCFILYFLTKLLNSNASNNTTDISLIFERVFWLSPQIFFHFIKLIVYPKLLSIDQTCFVKLSNSLLSNYSSFCFLLMYLGLAISILFLFISTKRKNLYFASLTFLLFFISLLPFLHIISPIYNLASERYLYLPTYALILGVSHFIRLNKKSYTALFLILTTILILFSYRSHVRSLDWKDSRTLLESATKTTNNKLFAGLRTLMTAHALKESNTGSYIEIKGIRENALQILEHSLVELNKKSNLFTTTPQIIKFYGLDYKTLIAKNAFLLAMCKSELGHKKTDVKETFSPYIKDLRVIDSQIISFYYPILFFTNDIENAERLLVSSLNAKRYNPNLFLALADVIEYKYRNLELAKNYLLSSFKLFPYDSTTLFGLRRIYRLGNDYKRFAHFSYLYELRTHDERSLEEAITAYLIIKDQAMSKKLLDELNRDYKQNESIEYLNKLYKEVFK